MFRRRRRGDEASTPDHGPEPVDDSGAARETVGKSDRTGGPFDAGEVDLEKARSERIDLGGLLIKPVTGLKMQLQVDKRSGNATSVVLTVEDAAVQLVAVAAPRSSGMWEQTRLQIAEDAKRRGGRHEEAPGPFGTEMRLVVPVQSPEGKQVLQPSRVSGIDGPRWLLRATFLGKATTDASAFQQMAALVRHVVVVRGSGPMAPGDVLVLKPPPGSQTGEGPTEPLQA